MPLSRDHARLALATIRLVNGTLALVAPNALLRRLGADPNVNKVAIYPMRMFGIRTVVLGVQLLIDAPSPEAARSVCSSMPLTLQQRSRQGSAGNCRRGSPP